MALLCFSLGLALSCLSGAADELDEFRKPGPPGTKTGPPVLSIEEASAVARKATANSPEFKERYLASAQYHADGGGFEIVYFKPELELSKLMKEQPFWLCTFRRPQTNYGPNPTDIAVLVFSKTRADIVRPQ